MTRTPALLALADGRVFHGAAAGADHPEPVTGEVVFNTSLSGYQEVITDPSYRGQLVAMTYPHQGNYGVNDADAEADAPHLSGFIARELEREPSNWRSEEGLHDYLVRHRVAAIDGIDTRALTRHIRDHGAQQGAIVSGAAAANPETAIAAAQAAPSMVGRDLAREVTCKAPYTWATGDGEPAPKFHVVAYDFGIKRNILRRLAAHGCAVTVVPANTPAEEVLAKQPDGVFLSNGPGDPAAVDYAVKTVQSLVSRVPVFGICLGHQILCLALGATTYKMRFGHHGGNQPVRCEDSKKVAITAQNHGFAVDDATLPDDLEITHVNLNDHTIEGVRHRTQPAFSVQHHPEAAPGPHDADDLFIRFTDLMTAHPTAKA